jgi:Ran GTPase-activating protein (RanGAP) involved in mRNA processing and transport
VSSNKIGDEGVKLILEGAIEGQTLISLDISKNCLTSKCCLSIARFVEKVSSINDLNLKGNLLETAGIKLLANGLRMHSVNLKTINLQSTGITLIGYINLFYTIIGRNSSLKKIKVDFNPINFTSDLPFKPAIKGLDKNRGLQSLSLTKCGLYDSIGSAMC